jgi:hypothetical protein
MSLILTAVALYISWRSLRRVSLAFAAAVVASWRAAERLVHQLWQLEQCRRDRAAIEALLAG